MCMALENYVLTVDLRLYIACCAAAGIFLHRDMPQIFKKQICKQTM